MRYHIDTIPVWDAYKQDSECPLCDIREHNEQMYAENFLGASVMEPAMRMEVNQKGFCKEHFAQMMQMKNPLGLSLMTHTYMQEEIKRMRMPEAAKGRGLFGKKEHAKAAQESCILCQRLQDTMDRYLYTVLHLWKKEEEFALRLQNGKGHCVAHHNMLMLMAQKELSPDKANAFCGLLLAVQRENMQRIEKELEWFTQKFDYRNTEKPWGNSKDALERAIAKLRGKQKQ